MMVDFFSNPFSFTGPIASEGRGGEEGVEWEWWVDKPFCIGVGIVHGDVYWHVHFLREVAP